MEIGICCKLGLFFRGLFASVLLVSAFSAAPPRQHSGWGGSVLWIQSLPPPASPRPGRGAYPSLQALLPSLSLLTPAVSCLSKISSLKYGRASSLWHHRHPWAPPPPGLGRLFSLVSLLSLLSIRPSFLIYQAGALTLCPSPHELLFTEHLLNVRPGY